MSLNGLILSMIILKKKGKDNSDTKHFLHLQTHIKTHKKTRRLSLMNKKIFISHSSGNVEQVKRIVAEIEKNKDAKCWYSGRDLQAGEYAGRLVEEIAECELFLLVLSEDVLARPKNVLNELNNHLGSSDSEMIVFTLDDIRPHHNLPSAFDYYTSRYSFIEGHSDFDSGINQLKAKVYDLLGISTKESVKKDLSIEEVDVTNEAEYTKRALELEAIKRLRDQNRLLDGFLGDLYSKTITNYSMANILDVGTNDGSAFYSRIGHHYNVNKIIGLEYSQELVELAKSANRPNAEYYCVDVESEDFENRLIEIRNENNLGDFGFDIINLSMVLLHFKNPLRVIRNLKKFLKPNGIIIVLDIDDKLNLAFPDKDGLFQQCFDIIRDTRVSGGKTRYCGREVYHYFRRADFSKIKLIKQGLSSADLSYDLKEALFRTYFEFTRQDYLKQERKRHFLDLDFYEKNAAWYKDNYQKILDQFMDPDFFFSLGFMIFTVQN